MPQNLAKEEVNVGNIIFTWKVKEYRQYERDRRWYTIMLVVGILLVAYGVIAANYLFALIIILFGIIIFLGDLREPLEVPFGITNLGIIVGNKFYRFSELNNFWVIYNPPEVKNLYFSFSSFFKHRLQVPLLDFDPRPIREYLNQYLNEDLEQEEEPMSDRFARLFRLH